MLIGVLCEVVSAVAAIEKETLTVNFVKEKLQEIIKTSGLDEDGNAAALEWNRRSFVEVPWEASTPREHLLIIEFSLTVS